MATGRRDLSYCAAVVGSIALGVSLWLPWYAFRIPGFLLQRAEQLAPQLGILGPLIRSGAAYLRTLGPLHVNGWQIFSKIDVVLIVVAVVGGGLALLALAGRASGVAAVVAVGGALAGAVTIYRLLEPPGPGGVLHPATGAYVALAGALTMLLGGLSAHTAARGDEWESLPLIPAGPAAGFGGRVG